MNNLDQAISSKLDSPHHKLCKNILRTNNWLVSRMQEVFKAEGLTMQQYTVLKIMYQQNPQPSTIQELKAEILERKSDVSRLVARLETKQLIKRRASSEDRRKTDLLLTQKGAERLLQVEKKLHDFELFLSNLEEKEINRTNALLEKLIGEAWEVH